MCCLARLSHSTFDKMAPFDERPCRVKSHTSRLIRLPRRNCSSGIDQHQTGFDDCRDPARGYTGRARCLRSRNSIVWSSVSRAPAVKAAFELQEVLRDRTYAPMPRPLPAQKNQGGLEATNARAV